jgi:hypothetical protein
LNTIDRDAALSKWSDSRATSDAIDSLGSRSMVPTVQMRPTSQSQCYGMLQCHDMPWTAWLWPYAPQGLPALTGQMDRPNPFDANDDLRSYNSRVGRKDDQHGKQHLVHHWYIQRLRSHLGRGCARAGVRVAARDLRTLAPLVERYEQQVAAITLDVQTRLQSMRQCSDRQGVRSLRPTRCGDK